MASLSGSPSQRLVRKDKAGDFNLGEEMSQHPLESQAGIRKPREVEISESGTKNLPYIQHSTSGP